MTECDCKMRGCPAANDVHCAYPVMLSPAALNRLRFVTDQFNRESGRSVSPDAVLQFLIETAATTCMESLTYALPKQNGRPT